MNRLFKILRTIFLARRIVFPIKIKYSIKNSQKVNPLPSNVEVPPPQSLTNQYAIGAPIVDDYVEFFNIYCAEFADEVFYNRCEIYIPYIGEATIKSLGAGRELQALLEFLKEKPTQEWLFRVFKIHGYFVIAANPLYNDTQFWYYCTQLELPEVRFNPAITFISLTKEKKNNTKEKHLDCSYKYKRDK